MTLLVLLRRVSLRRLREAWLRTSLTVMGIAAGSAMLVAMSSVNVAILDAFRQTLHGVAGQADLVVSGGPTGVPEDTLDRVRDIEGVKQALPALVEFTRVRKDGKQWDLMVLGADLAEGDAARDLDGFQGTVLGDFDPLAFLNDTEAILLSKKFAQRRGVRPGDRIEVATSHGLTHLKVHGLLEERGAALAFGGDMAVMDLYSLQSHFSRGALFDRIDVRLAEGAQAETVQKRLREALGPAFSVEQPGKSGQNTERMIRTFQVGLATGSFCGLLVGMFLVYNTVAFSVAQRRREIGTLRALGVTRRQVVALFAAEAAVYGFIGSALGLLLGVTVARGVLEETAASMSEIYVRINPADARLRPEVGLAAMLIGVLASVFAAWRPSREAAEVQPVEALRRDMLPGGELPHGWLYHLRGPLVAAVSMPLFLLPTLGGAPVFGMVALAGTLVGASLAAPAAILLVRETLGPLVARFLGAPGRIAADGLQRAPRRSSVAAGAVCISIALTVTTGAWTGSFRTTLLKWLDHTVPADLFAASSARIVGVQNTPLDPEVVKEFAAIEGVAYVDPVRLVQTDYEELRIFIVVLDAELYLRRGDPIFLEGGKDGLAEKLKAGQVMVAENLWRRKGLGVGSTIRLRAPGGEAAFPVAAVYVDYSSDQGLVAMDRATYERIFRDTRVDSADIYLQPGVEPEPVKRALLEKYGERYNLFVLTNREFRREIGDVVDRFFRITYALLFIALFISLLGIATTLLAQVVDRTREIGILRAVGASRAQVTASVAIEAALLGAAGAIVGLPSGAAMGYIFVRAVGVQATGWVVQYHFPWDIAAWGAVGATLAASIAGLLPARRAAGLDITEAISYE